MAVTVLKGSLLMQRSLADAAARQRASIAVEVAVDKAVRELAYQRSFQSHTLQLHIQKVKILDKQRTLYRIAASAQSQRARSKAEAEYIINTALQTQQCLWWREE